MKIVGLDYFGLDVNNPTLIKLSDICIKWKLDIVYSYINCFIYYFVIIKISNNENSSKINRYIICTFPIVLLLQSSELLINSTVYNIVFDLCYLYVFVLMYNNKSSGKSKRYWLFMLLSFIFQLISLYIRSASTNINDFNFIISFICNLDYIILNIIVYELYFKGGGILCYQVVDHSLSLLKKINLKKSLTKLQENLHNFKKLDRETKLTYAIYFVLSLIWNMMSVVIILLVAKLNNTFIECIFILTSFWLSKRSFGKAFHLSSMSQCFVVSNLTYYALNRITTPLGISILVPILLGVGLSYVTSKFVKNVQVKTRTPLYRGMPVDSFNELILKVVEKDSDKYNICYDYFISKENALYLSGKYDYSYDGIKKITYRINNKLKELK